MRGDVVEVVAGDPASEPQHQETRRRGRRDPRDRRERRGEQRLGAVQERLTAGRRGRVEDGLQLGTDPVDEAARARRRDDRARDQDRDAEAQENPQHHAHERPDPARSEREGGIVEQPPDHRRRSGLHRVEHPGDDPASRVAAQHRRDVDERPPARGDEHRWSGERVGHRGVEGDRGGRRADQPERGKAHRRDRPGQPLREARVEVGALPPVAAGRQRVERRDRAGLRQPRRARGVDRPFDVLRRAEVGLDAAAHRHQRVDLRIGERGRCAGPHDGLGATAGQCPDHDGLVADAVLDDRPVARPVAFDDDVVGVHRAGHDGLAQPGARVDDGAGAPPADRVGREQHAGDGDVHHLLHDHGERDLVVRDARRRAVG